jgi:hypothetical protein
MTGELSAEAYSRRRMKQLTYTLPIRILISLRIHMNTHVCMNTHRIHMYVHTYK